VPDLQYEADEQDQAEVFDEDNITEDGQDIAHLDMARNVYDVTTAQDDADVDGDMAARDAGDFDPDDLDETEIEQSLEADDGVDEARGSLRADSDLVASDDDSPADYETDADDPDLDDDDPDEDDGQGEGSRSDKRRDYEVEETFPASDSPPANPGAD
jgi:hypothetical protein